MPVQINNPAFYLILLLVVAPMLGVASLAQADLLPGGVAPATIELSIDNPALAEKLKRQLKIYADTLKKNNNQGARRREQAELGIIKKQLRAQGYYDNRVRSLGSSRYSIDPGPRYTIQSWQIEAAPLAIEAWPDLPLQNGQPLLAEQVLTAQNRLSTFLRGKCYPNARVDYEVVLNDKTHRAEIKLPVMPGSRAHIGAIEFLGLEDIEQSYLLNEISLKKGSCLRRAKLDDARLSLLQTGLLSSVDYEFDLPAPSDSKVNQRSQPVTVIFNVSERKNRSVKASVGYSTDAKEGFAAGWEHRNLFGRAERLEIDGGVDQISRYATARLTLPHFLQSQQELQFIGEVNREKPDAYTSRSRELAAILSRNWSGGRRGSIGVALSESRVDEGGDGDSFTLFSVPMALAIDRRDDAIDSRAGWLANVSLRPFTDLSEEELDFVQTAISVRSYVSIASAPLSPTLALRASAGGMTGAALTDIPADHRFYVGGGGSVRGYPYQTVGELTDGKADGGKSYSEASLELRLHFLSNWGLVMFADGGYAYPEELPKLGENFLWGAGLGLRYYTRFAPLRFDIAAPLNKREDVDNSFQIYISFGQSF